MTRSTKILGASALALIAVLALAGGAFWYTFLRGDEPAAVSLNAAVQSIATTTATASSQAGSAAETLEAGATASTEGGTIDGAWSIASTGESFVGYRVEEELASIGYTTAVGRTSTVTADVVIADGVLETASITADLTQLESDSDMRDRALTNQALQTRQYLTATFELSSPVALPAGLSEGEIANLTLNGALTIHGVTQEVSVPVEAQMVDGYLVAVGSLAITFADYDIQKPNGASVVSIEDHGVMELQLTLANDA
jgi:polyisoprenoid-binding protein YceI